jgi:NDP-sugar pyrophosphorylase family protein
MDRIDIGVLHAGGRGVRIYPKSVWMPKVMLEVEGKPIMERNLQILRDKFGIKKIYIVVGYLDRYIRDYFGNGAKFGVKITYIKDNDMAGLANATYLLKNYIKEPFVMILGDELYIDSNHEKMNDFLKMNDDFFVVCGVKTTENIDAIKRNYSVEIKNGRILKIVEKPEHTANCILGCGTYVINPKFFDFIPLTAKSAKTNRVELMDAIDKAAVETGKVYPFFLAGEYMNINRVEDLNNANYLLRNKNFCNYKISIIIPTKNEEKSIANVINDFKHQKGLCEILLIDASDDNTIQAAKRAGGDIVRTVTKKELRYGAALRYGMSIAKGDILILAEADSTFRAKDIGKILEYMKDADMVVGTRTTRQMIEQGANMDWFLRWGNVFLGKMVELLWWRQEPRFTDVGCTYRGIWKDFYNKIKDNLTAPGPEFSVEMMIEVLRTRGRIIEIPISYYKRMAGESKHSAKRIKAIKNGLKMIKTIIRKL